MEKKALYRKYRPAGFDGLVGQDHIKITLENAIKNSAVSHAYIFTGPRGTGKTSTAKLFASALNCENPNGINPCGTCHSCVNDTDIIEMDAASNNGVDDIRTLRETISLAPMYGKYKIYILDEGHMLTPQAFNAFLITLEEPPPHAIFIIATTEVHKLPATIISRCQRFDFRRITNKDIVSRLEYILTNESRTADKTALELIAQVSAGGMRDSISLLDQALSRKESPTEMVTLEDVLSLTGAVDVRVVGHLLYLISNKKLEEALVHFNTCFDEGKEPKFFIEELMIYLRDVLVRKKLGAGATLKKAATDSNFNIVADALNLESIFFYLEVLQKTLNDVKFHHDLQLLMEMSIIRMVNGDTSSLQKQIDELRSFITNGELPSPVEIAPIVESPTMAQELPVMELPNVEVPIIEQSNDFDNMATFFMAGEQDVVELNDFKPSELNFDLSPMVEIKEPILEVENTTTKIIVNQSEHDVVVLDDPIDFLQQAVDSHRNGVDWASTFPSETNTNESIPEPNVVSENNTPAFSNEPVENFKFEVPVFEPTPESNELPSFFVSEVNSMDTLNNENTEGQTLEPITIPEFVGTVESTSVYEDIAHLEVPSYEPVIEVSETVAPAAASTSPRINMAPINSGNVILSDNEQNALNILKSATADELNAFNACLESIKFELGNVSISSKRVFSEFEVRAVSSTHFIITHKNKVNVSLINKLAHKKNISEVLANVFKELDYVAITNDEWNTISSLD